MLTDAHKIQQRKVLANDSKCGRRLNSAQEFKSLHLRQTKAPLLRCFFTFGVKSRFAVKSNNEGALQNAHNLRHSEPVITLAWESVLS